MKQLIISNLVVFIFVEVTGMPDCRGEENRTSLYCDDLVLEVDKPLNIKKIIKPPDDSRCSETECSDYIYPEFAISRSHGSIGVKTFSLMPEIEDLSFYMSRISYIEDGSICSLPNLKKFVIKQGTVLPDLTESTFGNCGKLKSFRCESCYQLDLTILKNMIGLESLSISSNRIANFTKEYLKPLTALKELRLRNLSIDEINEGALCLPPNLETLSLMYNMELPTLTKSVFSNCKNVKEFELMCSENLNIEEDAFSSFINVKSVYLFQLNINRLNKEFLSGFKNAETLFICNSTIAAIDTDAFSDFDKLITLNLQYMRLTEVDPEMIKKIPSLLTLSLGQNKLTSIDNITHPLLENLWLSENEITDINGVSLKTNLPHLKRIFIDINPITSQKRATLASQLGSSVEVF